MESDCEAGRRAAARTASSGGSKLVIYVPQGRGHNLVAQRWHQTARRVSVLVIGFVQ
jgi:hypothetical protein